MLKQRLKFMIYWLVEGLLRTRVGRFVCEVMLEDAMQRSVTVRHKKIEIKFAIPNPLLHWRALTFAEKEPETLRWIDSFGVEETVWDIGANVGLYALYSAKSRQANVWAFEPSIFNLEVLGRNIAMNELADKIKIMPIALSDCVGFSRMKHSSTQWGGALSTFGVDYGADGKPLVALLGYDTFGMSMDDVVAYGFCPAPDHIKIDVDGIEHIILSGGQTVLRTVKSVLVEINDDFGAQRKMAENILKKAGLTLEEKERSIYTDASGSVTPNVFNQIWKRTN